MAETQHEIMQRGKPVPKKSTPTPRLMEVLHDETPSQITDHAFEPRGEWYTLCKHCRLSEAAHVETTLTGTEHLHFPHASVETTPTGRERFHYFGDDDDDD